MRELLQTTAELAIRYLEALDTRNVAPTQEAIAKRSSASQIANFIQFGEPLPNEPVDAELVLQQLDEVGSPASMAQAGSRIEAMPNFSNGSLRFSRYNQR